MTYHVIVMVLNEAYSDVMQIVINFIQFNVAVLLVLITDSAFIEVNKLYTTIPQ
jgi:hypothetical protein